MIHGNTPKSASFIDGDTEREEELEVGVEAGDDEFVGHDQARNTRLIRSSPPVPEHVASAPTSNNVL